MPLPPAGFWLFLGLLGGHPDFVSLVVVVLGAAVIYLAGLAKRARLSPSHRSLQSRINRVHAWKVVTGIIFFAVIVGGIMLGAAIVRECGGHSYSLMGVGIFVGIVLCGLGALVGALVAGSVWLILRSRLKRLERDWPALKRDLTTCPDCGCERSKRVSACPHCGAGTACPKCKLPMQVLTQQQAPRRVTVAGVVGALLYVLGWFLPLGWVLCVTGLAVGFGVRGTETRLVCPQCSPAAGR